MSVVASSQGRRGRLLVLSAPSGTGKTTVIQKVIDINTKKLTRYRLDHYNESLVNDQRGVISFTCQVLRGELCL